MKQCFKCKEEKILSDYYKHPATKDGYLGKCKKCAKKDAEQIRLNPKYREKILQRDRDRNKTENRRQFWRSRKFRIPEKIKARGMVNIRVHRGTMRRGVCELCGVNKTEAHHLDYSKPLLVMWLCKQHHQEVEKQKNL